MVGVGTASPGCGGILGARGRRVRRCVADDAISADGARMPGWRSVEPGHGFLAEIRVSCSACWRRCGQGSRSAANRGRGSVALVCVGVCGLWVLMDAMVVGAVCGVLALLGGLDRYKQPKRCLAWVGAVPIGCVLGVWSPHAVVIALSVPMGLTCLCHRAPLTGRGMR